MGNIISQFIFFAFSIIERAVSCISCSHKDWPILYPLAAKNVLAIPPPITILSIGLIKFSNKSNLEDTFAPPTTAITGFFGELNAFSNLDISSSINLPAQLGIIRAIASTDACALCAVEKVSDTNISPSFANSAANSGSFFFSP